MKVTDTHATHMHFFFITLVKYHLIPLVCVCSGTSVSAEVDEAELEDGTKIQPVSVLFPEGSRVPAPPHSEVLLNIPADVHWNRHRVQWQVQLSMQQTISRPRTFNQSKLHRRLPSQPSISSLSGDTQVPTVISLPCSVSFCCSVPLSLCTTITFTDHLRNR